MTLLSHFMTLLILSPHKVCHVSKFNIHVTTMTLPLRLALQILSIAMNCNYLQVIFSNLS